MTLNELINYNYVTNKYRFIISLKNECYDVINTGYQEITFNDLFNICGLWLLNSEVEKCIYQGDSQVVIILKDS